MIRIQICVYVYYKIEKCKNENNIYISCSPCITKPHHCKGLHFPKNINPITIKSCNFSCFFFLIIYSLSIRQFIW